MPESPPNILFIMTDQQRKDSLGCYGNDICRTPNLDRLAERGMRFERNYVANPICMPNRLSIFTGQNIRNHGLWTNGLLIDERQTLPGWFAENGYRTANIGKIHFTPFGGNAGNKESKAYWASPEADVSWHGPYWGFQHVELTLAHTEPLAHYGEWLKQNGGTEDMLKRKPELGGTCKIPPDLHHSSFVGERAVEFLRASQHKQEPFFLVASFPDPHHPFDPPEDIAAKYNPKEINMPIGGKEDLATRPDHYRRHFRGEFSRKEVRSAEHPEGLSEAETHRRIANTYAMVDLIDQNVGKIMDYLDKSGLGENTIVVFTSDHGELLGDHGLWKKGPFYYEGLINTPLLLAGPDVPEGQVSEALVSAFDIGPTLCDLAGVPPMSFVDGVSQKPHIEDPDYKCRSQCLVEYRNGYGENDISSKCLVTETLKYVRYETGQEELTDLANDPSENRNVAEDSKYHGKRNSMSKALLDEILATEQKGPEQVSHA